MSNGKAIYQHVCGEPDQERAVQDLPDEDLRTLRSYVEMKGLTGFYRTICGLAIVVQADRFQSNGKGMK